MRIPHVSALLLAAAAPALAQIPRGAVEVDGPLFSSSAGSAIAAGSGGLVAMLFKDAASAPADDLYLVRSLDGGVTWGAPLKINVLAGTKFLQSDSICILGTDAFCGWTVETGLTPAPDTEEDFAFCVVDLAAAVPFVSVPEMIIPPSPGGIAAGQIRDFEFACSRGAAGVHVGFLSNFDAGPANGLDRAWAVTAPAGLLFTPPVPLSPPPPLDCDNIALDAEGDDFVAIWDDNGPAGGAALDTLFLSVNPAGGAPGGWSPPIMVNTFLVDDIEDDVDVSVRAGKIFVAWLHEIGGAGSDHPFGRTFTVAGPGAPLGPQLPLHTAIPGGDGDEVRARLSAALNPVALFDYDTAGPDTIFAATSTDCGMLGFMPQVTLSPGEGSFVETVAGPDGVVAATWSGFPGATGDRAETAFSCDDGLTWTVLDANTTGFDSDFGVVAYDASKRDVIVGFHADPPGTNQSFAGGFSVCTPPTFVTRNAGTNPLSLSVSSAQVGGALAMSVDLTLTGHTLAVVFAFDTPFPGLLLGGGQTLLCIDGGSGELLGGKSAPGPMASFSCPIPNLPCFNEYSLCMQAIHAFGVVPYALSNAVDVTIGSM